MARETEVVEYLNNNAVLAALAPGGIYADSALGAEGISDALTTPDVWTGGVFQTTIIVRQRMSVPTGLFTSFKSQVSDSNQALGVWVYGLTLEAIEAVLDAVYALMLGHAFETAWPTVWVAGGVPFMQCPELPTGIYQMSQDYQIRSLRRAVAVE